MRRLADLLVWVAVIAAVVLGARLALWVGVLVREHWEYK